ncbi:MAG: pyruvate/2-oxoglutarate dehydrogenase complex dihydrolipoamide dehydrogenase (E3) component [Hyphomicrobiaceae bacterium]|jgi:pyruvate/2-oxoglutarate dehydrogenase complex dihydrolipoamide dehydrogenase (E3) component
MVTLSFDAIIIGTGQAGPSLAARLASEGQQVAIVEKSLFGGTCVNNGCIPTKALVASARTAHVARRAAEFGVNIGGEVQVDMQRVHDRMKQISGASNKGVEGWLEGLDGVTVIRRQARFEANDTIRAGEQLIEAPQIFLNVGGRPIVPDSFANCGAMTNVEMLQLTELPEHLIVVGGSYIGLEFAQIFRRFGSKVTVVQRGPRIIAREDEDVSQSVHESLEAEGITIRTDANCLSGERRGDQVAVQLSCGDSPEWLEGSHLLLAVGRQPNTDDLGIQNTDIKLDKRGYVQVDDTLRTKVEGVWALGDCNGRGAFTHTAYNDYEIAANQLLDDARRKVSDRHLAYGLFVDPPLGRVGMNKQEARASSRNVLIGHRKMAQVGRAKERSETHGFMEVLVDADSEQILGATVHGIEGDEIVHSLLNMMYAGASYRVVAESMPIHPTVSELLPTLLQSLKPLK